MNDDSFIKLITGPLKPDFAILLMLVGLYSIFINVKHETRRNYIRSAKVARIGGWFFIISGFGLFVVIKFL